MSTTDFFSSPDQHPPADETWAVRREVAELLRQLSERNVADNLELDDYKSLKNQLQTALDTYGDQPLIGGRLQMQAAGLGDFGTVAIGINPVCGIENPIAPPIKTWLTDNEVHGRATMGWRYEGPPMAVHGGWVAALFDDFLGMGQRLTKRPGFTGRLTVNYLKPTPLNTELKFRGWVEKSEGRKNTLKGELIGNGEVTATCEGLFIAPKADSVTEHMKKLGIKTPEQGLEHPVHSK